MDIFLTLTTVGVDQGNLFDLYSNVDGFDSPFETDVAIASLLAGYVTILAPDGTIIVRICGQGALCVNCVDIRPIYTTTTSTTLTPIGCDESSSSGGVGVTEYIFPLEIDGGILIIDFEPYGVVDKLEILHQNVKQATTGMTVVNAGPFDDIYGDPLVPTQVQAALVDQFIGTSKGIAPTRGAVFFSETGLNITVNRQQLIWWEYDAADVAEDASVIVRITGPSGTAWIIERRCTENIYTLVANDSRHIHTADNTVIPTTTTTTTLIGLEEVTISIVTSITPDCGLALIATVYIDTQFTNVLSAGDTVYTNSSGTIIFVGNGDYYHVDMDGAGSEYSARITSSGEVLPTVIGC